MRRCAGCRGNPPVACGVIARTTPVAYTETGNRLVRLAFWSRYRSPKHSMRTGTLTRATAAAGGVSKRFYSERELSVYAGLSVRTLQGWRMRNLGPPFRKFCGSVRYDLGEFDAWAAAQPGGGGLMA